MARDRRTLRTVVRCSSPAIIHSPATVRFECSNQSTFNKKAQPSLGKADRTAYVRSPASNFQSRT